MEPAKNSRIAAARARATAAKQMLVASAVVLFFGAMLGARATHAAHASGSPSTPSSGQSADDSFYGGFDSGSLAPAQSTPQTSTGSS
jgi:hypothetical protein